MTGLESLNLYKTGFAEDFWVQSDGFVSSLGVIGEQMLSSHVSSIAALSNLRTLNISGQNIENIDFLTDLTSLEYMIGS